MNFGDILFKRRFSVNYHGNLKLKSGEMSFHKNFINDRRGDPYPLFGGTHYGSGSNEIFGGSVEETVKSGRYTVIAKKGSIDYASEGKAQFDAEYHGRSEAEKNGVKTVKRLMGGFFPWFTYEIDFDMLFRGGIGLSVESPKGCLSLMFSSSGKVFVSAEGQCFDFDTVIPNRSSCKRTLTVSFHSDRVSVYMGKGGEGLKKICSLTLPILRDLCREKELTKAHTYLLTDIECGGEISLTRVEWFITAGLSQADIRPVKYENGEIMIRDGRIFLTASARPESGSYQIIISWEPTSCDFRLEGALFFDCGDGILCGDVASSIIWDRSRDKWIIWMCMFSHGHFLGRTELNCCPLFGINYIDVQPMDKADDGDEITAFKGFRGDEDPDLIKIGNTWHLAICRIDGGAYKYYHFISDMPTDGFRFVDRTIEKEKTGGNFVLCHDGKVVFVCGSDFSKRAVYDAYPISDFSTPTHLKCDFDDGGFRGWGSVMLLPIGTRRRYTWITFDRHNASDFNWSYGNIYVFDSESFK